MAQARAHLDLALKFAMENDERLIQSMSRMLLGHVLAKTEPSQIEEAQKQTLHGIGLADQLGLRPFSAQGYLFLGEVYTVSRQKEMALENLKKAESMFKEMGMDYWTSKAQRALERL